MPDRLGPVRLFGKDYRWHRIPGQPLELLAIPAWPDLPALTPGQLYEETVRMMGSLLPWPEKEQPGG